MERKETKILLERELDKLFTLISQMDNKEAIIQEVNDLVAENPKNNKDNEIFFHAIKYSLKDTSTSDETKRREFSVLSMAYFLWKYESTYLLCVDTVCRLLILTGHDLFDPIKRQFAESIEEISEVDISTKQKFLDRHNFGIITNPRYQKVRNKIAHHDYFYDENQRLHIGNELMNMSSFHHDFLEFTGDIFSEICTALSKYVGPEEKT